MLSLTLIGAEDEHFLTRLLVRHEGRALRSALFACVQSPIWLGVDKSSSHHLSQNDIDDDNPCSQQLSERTERPAEEALRGKQVNLCSDMQMAKAI